MRIHTKMDRPLVRIMACAVRLGIGLGCLAPAGGLAQSTQPELQVYQRGERLVLDWDQRSTTGVLQAARELDGPWSDVAGATAPFQTHPAAGHRFYRLGPGSVTPGGPVVETLAARTEANMGTWLALPQSDWMFTRGSVWTHIRSGARPVAPIYRSMSGSFVASAAQTPIAVFFSAEAYVEPADKRMFVRALVDGSPLAPADVVFSSGLSAANQETRGFIFTGRVDPGLHTVELQWLADRESTARIRDAAFLVRLGDSPNSDGSLQVFTPPSGPEVSTTVSAWSDVPGLSGAIQTEKGESLAISVSAESYVLSGGTMFLRALVDGSPAAPSDVLFAKGSDPQCRLVTFGVPSPDAGLHTVTIQWQVSNGGAAFLGDRSLVLSATPKLGPAIAQVFVAPPSGPAEMTSSSQYSPMPGMSASGKLPANGEVAVLLSAVTSLPADETLWVRLVIDGNPVPDSEVALAHSDLHQGVHSHVFSAKHLYPAGPPETSTVRLEWRVEKGGTALLDDRTMLVLVKRPTVPDLAEPSQMGTGNFPIDPEIGTRRVLVILWDPNRPGHPAPSTAAVAQGVFGATSSIQHYFSVISGGKYQLVNALGGTTVLGWYPATSDWTNYFGGAPGCSNDGGNLERRRREMLIRAAQDIDFSSFDDNQDGVLDPRLELGVLLVIPNTGPTVDKVRQVYDVDCGWLAVDGVIVPVIAEWLTGDPSDDWRFAAHEIAHLMLSSDDAYLASGQVNTAMGRLSLMDQLLADHMPHLSAQEKLALGWVTPKTIKADGIYALQDVKVSREVLVLPRLPGKATDEYYLLENRQESADPLTYDTSIFDSGVAVWHVVHGPTDNGLPPVCMTPGGWSETGNGNTRRGIRLVRPRVSFSSVFALWSSDNYDLLDAGLVCPSAGDDPEQRRNVLQWADGTPSQYGIIDWSAAADTMTFQIITP